MELIVAGVIGGLLLALAVWKVIYEVVGRAVDNLIRWSIYNFGNEAAVRRLRAEDDPDSTDTVDA